jgi:hypothetical protein
VNRAHQYPTPLACRLAELRDPAKADLMRLVASAAAGGMPTLLWTVAEGEDVRDAEGRVIGDTLREVPVAVIVSYADFARLQVKPPDTP